ncbi:MAG: tRNA 2-thiouridine(34) synthase MnmA, partial [Treponemataceae bacterium]
MNTTFNFEYAQLPEKGSHVLVGMSGGVDSTVTALMLLERGCKVTGVTMSTWNNDLPLIEGMPSLKNSCYGPDEADDINESKAFCASVGIDHLVIDVKDTYKKLIIDYFTSEYRSGRTPNPCIRCNAMVKFGALLEGTLASNIDFDYFCTGHYANLIRPTQNIVPQWDMKGENGQNPFLITQAQDISKDQSYFLYRIPSSTLEKVRFPLGALSKKEVFAYAREKHLEAAERQESQDFVPPE